jgi:hypothetical protein
MTRQRLDMMPESPVATDREQLAIMLTAMLTGDVQ